MGEGFWILVWVKVVGSGGLVVVVDVLPRGRRRGLRGLLDKGRGYFGGRGGGERSSEWRCWSCSGTRGAGTFIAAPLPSESGGAAVVAVVKVRNK